MPDPIEFPTSPFWDFSRATYGRPGVAPASLGLQDRRGLDVNLILFCCWAGSRGRTLEPADLRRLSEATEDWRTHVVEPLREVRRWLKGYKGALPDLAQGLRSGVLARELDAEHVEQLKLTECLPVPEGQGGPALAAQNLKAYFEARGLRLEAADVAGLATIVAGCFDETAPSNAIHLFD